MAAKRTGSKGRPAKIIYPPWPRRAVNYLHSILIILGKPFYWLIVVLIKGFWLFFHLIKKYFRLIFRLTWLGGFLFLLYYFLINILYQFPDPNQLITRQPALTTKIYDRHNTLLYKIYRSENRSLVELKEIPLSLIQATIAIEDAEFYFHHGISVKGIIRALLRNLEGEKLYGGSTITQQLVKNTLLTPERTWSRKAKEIILAVLVEKRFSKDQILQMYLNEVGYGGASYGVEEASWKYYGKTVGELNLAEAALLAGLPAAPTTYSPLGTQPEKAKERQKLVLKRMREEGFITAEQEKQAAKAVLKFVPPKTDIQAPHFVMYVKDRLVQKYGERLVEEGGLEVKTTLDLTIQEKAQAVLTAEVRGLAGLRISNGAALIIRPQSGEILAMVGSVNYFDLLADGNVNVTLRPRQPGSAIKPVTYSLALEKGFTPATIIPDTPITYQIPGQPPYSPKNYDSRFHGHIPLRIALGSSYNVPAVKVLSALGVENLIRRGTEMGITTWDDPARFGLSLTLGGGEVKMTDLATAYGVLANSGRQVDLNPILTLKNYQGEILEENRPENTRSHSVIKPETAFLLTDILADNAARTPAFGGNSLLNIPDHPHVAVKTGTTQNLRDNWTIGYTPDFLVAVWVGNNDNTPMSYVASGITGASPIWNKIMTDLLKDVPDKEFPPPEGIIRTKVCGKEEFFLKGTEASVRCPPSPSPTPS
jgi:1A family penicillin-binding protein